MKHSILWLITCALTACGPLHGTGTGNPFQNGASSPQSSVSGSVFYYTCQVLKKCNPGMTDFMCGTGVENVVGFGAKLGLTDDSLTAGQIVSYESQKLLKADAVQGTKCSAQLLKLSCDDFRVQEAYDPASPQPFAKTPEMLDPVCTGVFGP